MGQRTAEKRAGYAHSRFFSGGLSLALAGSGTSLYSLYHHLDLKADGLSEAACNISATVNCNALAQSPYSEVWQLPLAVWGLGYFCALLAVLLLGHYAPKPKAVIFLAAYLPLTLIGVLASVVLASLSFFVVKALCLACTFIYAITLAQAGWCWHYRHERFLFPENLSLKLRGIGLAASALPLLMVLGAYSLYARNFYQAHTPAAPSSAALNSPQAMPDSPPLTSTAKTLPLATSAFGGLGEDYRYGSDTARVVLQVFSDFQCPACKQMNALLHSLASEYGPQILIVYRNFPLDTQCNPYLQQPIHAQACKMAVLARCAGLYGKFWPYHDLLYARQQQATAQALESWALQLGLTQEQIASCLESKSILDKVKDDIKLGQDLGVSATPSLFLNGYKFTGQGMEALKAAIDHLLATQEH